MTDAASPAQILVLDFGGQYAHLISKRIRSMGVPVQRMPGDTPMEAIRRAAPRGVIGSGGPDSVYAPDAPRADERVFGGELPYLGICYGMQLLAHAGQGRVQRVGHREDGDTRIRIDRPDCALFRGLPSDQQVWMSHGDSVTEPPPGYAMVARSDDGILAAIAHDDGRRFGVQFHPEVNDTRYGNPLLSNFVFGVCGAERTLEHDVELSAKEDLIREVVGADNVLVFLSGGVDSSVVARMCLRALPARQVYAVHVDHGFMREGESRDIVARFADFGFDPGHLVLAEESARFLAATTRLPPEGTREFVDEGGRVITDPPRAAWPRTATLAEETDPQAKRVIIGDTFMEVARARMAELGLGPHNTYLVQGTLYTDLIESGSREVSQGEADVIKFHHNDTPLVREFRAAGRVLEPNASWYKDDVRKVAVQLDLGQDLAWRRPFPGPGLAIRILCADGPCDVPNGLADLARSIDAAVTELGGGRFTGRLAPVATVGVQGDARTYAPIALLYGDPSGPGFWEAAREVAVALPRREDRINRVVAVLAQQGSDASTPAWSDRAATDPTTLPDILPTRLGSGTADLLRAVHRVGERALRAADPDRRVAQMPFVLFPADLSGTGQRAVAIRGIVTHDFMTGQPVMPGRDLDRTFFDAAARAILVLTGVGAVVVDLTSKPPATTCWE